MKTELFVRDAELCDSILSYLLVWQTRLLHFCSYITLPRNQGQTYSVQEREKRNIFLLRCVSRLKPNGSERASSFFLSFCLHYVALAF